MKKIFKIAMAVMAACMMTVVMTVTAFAEVKDVEISTANATMSPPWGQSLTVTGYDFNVYSFTEATEVIIEYETEGGAMPDNGYNPAELIFQHYLTESPIWCQIAPYEFDETSAKFSYADIVAAYTGMGGKEDFSNVDNVCIGATFVGVKVTKVTVTNLSTDVVVTTTTAAASETEAVTEAVTEAATEAETTTAAPAAEKESGGVPIVLIVVITVVVAVIAVVIFIVLKNRNRFY